jgi:hypothetical protein
MEWNHNAIMKEGGKALGQLVGATLISAKS